MRSQRAVYVEAMRLYRIIWPEGQPDDETTFGLTITDYEYLNGAYDALAWALQTSGYVGPTRTPRHLLSHPRARLKRMVAKLRRQ